MPLRTVEPLLARPCSVIGAWQNFFGLEVNGEGGALSGLPRCMEGAIRFDDSGRLSRLTSVGWVGGCSYTRCGDPISM